MDTLAHLNITERSLSYLCHSQRIHCWEERMQNSCECSYKENEVGRLRNSYYRTLFTSNKHSTLSISCPRSKSKHLKRISQIKMSGQHNHLYCKAINTIIQWKRLYMKLQFRKPSPLFIYNIYKHINIKNN